MNLDQTKVIRLAEHYMKLYDITIDEAMKLAKNEAFWDEFYWEGEKSNNK